MLAWPFETPSRKRADAAELSRLHIRYGGQLIAVLTERAESADLPLRDRQHWRRMLRKAKKASGGASPL